MSSSPGLPPQASFDIFLFPCKSLSSQDISYSPQESVRTPLTKRGDKTLSACLLQLSAETKLTSESVRQSEGDACERVEHPQGPALPEARAQSAGADL